MKPLLLITVLIGVAVVVFIVSRFRVAEPGTLAALPGRLAKLKEQDRDPAAFVGFCTRDEDALYIVHQDGVFYLDYELTTPEKTSQANSFRKVAADLGFAVTQTHYNPRYLVLRVTCGASERDATDVALAFAQRLFGHDANTVYEFLP